MQNGKTAITDKQTTAKVAEKYDKTSLVTEEQTPEDLKPKRKYKPRAKKKEADLPVKSLEVIALLFSEGGIVAKRSPVWTLDPGEMKSLATATDNLAIKYTSDFFKKYSEEVTFVTVALAIAIPRLLAKPKPHLPDPEFPELHPVNIETPDKKNNS